MARKHKRIRLELLEGWGERQQLDDDVLVEDSSPEGWQQGEDQTTTEDTLPGGWQLINIQNSLSNQLHTVSYIIRKAS